MWEIIQREAVYVGYYFMVQLRQIFRYWVLGMVIGSLISVFAKNAIHSLFGGLRNKRMGIWGVIPASLLGTASPLCMYGTIPIAASFWRQGMRDDWLAAFMMSSILLNPESPADPVQHGAGRHGPSGAADILYPLRHRGGAGGAFLFRKKRIFPF